MTYLKKNKSRKPGSRVKKGSKEKYPGLDDLVVDRSLPPVQVKVFPTRRKSRNKPAEQMVIELQCEV
jgi:hypothetical protein